MSRVLAISDIHGHSEALLRLLEAAAYDARSDELLLLGDYVDTDARSWHALGDVRRLCEAGARALPGNLEVWLRDRVLSRHPDALPPKDAAFVRGLPGYIAKGGWLFAHAGIRPGIPLPLQSEADLTGIREAFWGHAGRLPYTVVFGHTPTARIGAAPGEPWVGVSRIGIDTGAKHGGRLTLVDLTGGRCYSCRIGGTGAFDDFRVAPLPGLPPAPSAAPGE